MQALVPRSSVLIRSILVLIIAFFIVAPYTVTYVYAEGPSTSISGDEVCGATASSKCTINDLKSITTNVMTYVIGLGFPILVAVILYRFIMAWFALQQGNAGAYKEALKKSLNASLGFLLIVALLGGVMYVMLKYFGVKDGPLQLLKIFSLIQDAFIPHAYAQATSSTGYLPNPLAVNNLYDFILSIVRLIIRFFLYPALIVIWVWTGFGFVAAQGNPEALTKVKKWLLWAFVTTILVFMIQAFLLAAQGTVKRILPGFTPSNASAGNTTNNGAPSSQSGTLDNRPAPTPGQTGSSCTLSSGLTGIVGTDGICYSSSRGQTGASSNGCVSVGASCTTTTGGNGKCVQGNASQDFSLYCSALPSGSGGLSNGATCSTNANCASGNCLRDDMTGLSACR
jgi:preprotein translocase subunit SecG